jgi:hypothetical protein
MRFLFSGFAHHHLDLGLKITQDSNRFWLNFLGYNLDADFFPGRQEFAHFGLAPMEMNSPPYG